MNLILNAAHSSELAHRGQVRKYTGTPYIWHPMRVAGRTSLMSLDPTLVAAAWLHDCDEDTGYKLDQILSDFGSCVYETVYWLTNPSKKHPDLPRAQKKAMDRRHLSAAPANAKLIKLIDRIDNLREMGGADPEFLKLYREESMLLLNESLTSINPDLEAELITLAGAE